MNIELKPYDYDVEYTDMMTELLYSTDPVLHQLSFGPQAHRVIRKYIELWPSYLLPGNMNYIWTRGQFVGLVIIYSVQQANKLNQLSHTCLKKSMGYLPYYLRWPIFRRINKMLTYNITADFYYINGLAISQPFRGKGVGTEVISKLSDQYHKLSLFVNDQNHSAIRFYLANGFQINSHHQMTYRRKKYGEYLMLKG